MKAIRYRREWSGPCFGVDLDINDSVTSNLGHSYDCDSSLVIDSLEAKISFLDTQKAQIKEL
jgi:hypothetical protein